MSRRSYPERMQVCLNGHVMTTSSRMYPSLMRDSVVVVENRPSPAVLGAMEEYTLFQKAHTHRLRIFVSIAVRHFLGRVAQKQVGLKQKRKSLKMRQKGL